MTVVPCAWSMAWVPPGALIDATTAACRDATGMALGWGRILLCNAAAVIGHLADRAAGHWGDHVLGGRTLAATAQPASSTPSAISLCASRAASRSTSAVRTLA